MSPFHYTIAALILMPLYLIPPRGKGTSWGDALLCFRFFLCGASVTLSVVALIELFTKGSP